MFDENNYIVNSFPLGISLLSVGSVLVVQNKIYQAEKYFWSSSTKYKSTRSIFKNVIFRISEWISFSEWCDYLLYVNIRNADMSACVLIGLVYKRVGTFPSILCYLNIFDIRLFKIDVEFWLQYGWLGLLLQL